MPNLRSDPLGHRPQLLHGRDRLVLGRHVPKIDVVHHLDPVPQGRSVREIDLQRIQAKISLFLFGSMTTIAMFLEKWNDRRLVSVAIRHEGLRRNSPGRENKKEKSNPHREGESETSWIHYAPSPFCSAGSGRSQSTV